MVDFYQPGSHSNFLYGGIAIILVAFKEGFYNLEIG